jgi:tRNA A-37 threonylcarbamoyl transferase component Bud32
VPSQIARFTITRYLGEGAFGRVYQAEDPLLKRTVALKVAKPEQLSGEKRVERFQREARAAANLLHPHIVAVFDSGQDGPLHYIASAFVPGRSLADVLAETTESGKRLDLREAVQIVRKLAEALAYAHEQGVVHRDVKPGNVMLREDGQPLLMDFGLAARNDETERLTMAGQFMGTPEYTSPEQWRGEAQPASDQYSLGCLMFELLTGEKPFSGGSSEHYLMLHTQMVPSSPRKVRPDLPRDLETICLKCLEKEPRLRYRDCQALADDLRRWLEDEPVTARRVGVAGRAMKWARRSPLLASLVATTVLALVGGTVVSMYFAFDAREKEKRADTKKREANAALAEVEENLAVGLLRPLGHFTDEARLNDFELEALEELASLPRERDPVRLLFVERALETEGTIGQLDRRLEEAVIAAVGLRLDLRDEALRVVGGRLRETKTPTSARVACARLAAALGLEDPLIAKDAVDVLLSEMTRTKDENRFRALSTAFAVLSAKLTPQSYAAVAGQLAGVVNKTSDPDVVRKFSEMVADRASAVPPVEDDCLACALGERVIKLADRTGRSDALLTLSRAFKYLTDARALEGTHESAPALGVLIIKAVGRSPSRDDAHRLSEAMKALSGTISATEAANLSKSIVSVAEETKNGHALLATSRVFVVLSRELAPVERGKLAAALAGRILDVTGKTTNNEALDLLRESFAAVVPKLVPTDAAALAGQVRDLAQATTYRELVRTLSEMHAALSVKLDRANAEKIAAALGNKIARGLVTAPPGDLLALARAFAAISGQLAPSVTDKLAISSSKEIASYLDKARDVSDLLALSEAFAIDSRKLPAPEAATIAAKLGKQLLESADSPGLPEPDTEGPILINQRFAPVLRARALALTFLTGHLVPAQTTKLAIALAKQVADETSNATTPEDLRALSEAVTALSGKLPPAERNRLVVALGNQIVAKAVSTTASSSLAELSEAFVPLVPHFSRESGRNATVVLASCLVRTLHQQRDNSTTPALEKLCALLSPEHLVDLLKQPGCVEPGRTVILNRLGRHFSRDFRNTWELAAFAERLYPALDCFSPLRCERKTPQSRRRAATASGAALEAGSSTDASAAPTMFGD